jgi:cytochrome c
MRQILALTLLGWVPSAMAQAADPCLTVADSELKKATVTTQLSKPMEMAVAPDGRIFVVEKTSGKIRIVDGTTGAVSDAGQVSVYDDTHEGMLGLALDPNFATNHFVYVYYSHASEAKHELARFTESGGKLADASKVVMLTVPGIRWTNEHHSAGSLAFGPDGNLYVATGENVNPNVSQGYASTNEASRQEDTQATAANTNDLNGKILRIHPEANGTYTIPTGNLFAASAKSKGEIYAMGMRNPIRIAVDSKTGWVYWGEPGADATTTNASRGPIGRDEINRAKTPGFFGWPYFAGNNLAYIVGGAAKDPAKPSNTSTNNTGETTLPAAVPALLDYTDDGNSLYPAFKSNAARASIIGGVYHFNAALNSPKRLPPRFDGSLFTMDWSRHWINEVTFTATGDVKAVTPFYAAYQPGGPIDMAFGPDGVMYVLEYDTHAITRIEYAGTCKMDGTTALRFHPGHAAQARQQNALWSQARGRMLVKAGAARTQEKFDGRAESLVDGLGRLALPR